MSGGGNLGVAILEHPRPLVEAHYNDVANAPLSACLNSGYAAAVIEGAGHRYMYYDYLSRDDGSREPALPAEMARDIAGGDPDLVLIHWVYNWDDGGVVVETIRLLREMNFRGIIAAFGLFPTFCGSLLLGRVGGLDMVFVGEFEETLREFLGTGVLDRDRAMAGLLTRGHDGGRRPPLVDLSRLPVPRDLGKSAGLSALNVAAARGCHGRCGFCFVPAFYGNHCWRGRPVAAVMEEIDRRRRHRADGDDSCNYVYFVEPNFFGPGERGQRRALAIGDGMGDRGLGFGLEARVDHIQAGTIDHLARCGLQSVFLGIESASPAVLARMKKNITPARAERAVGVLRDCGIFVSLGFIMFEAESGLEDLRLNFEFLKRNRLCDHHDQTVNVLYHNQVVLWGTPAYHDLGGRGFLLPSSLSPFEFNIRDFDPLVGALKAAMMGLSLTYFKGMDRLWRGGVGVGSDQYDCAHCADPFPGFPGGAVNDLFVGSFGDFLDAASRKDIGAIGRLARERQEALGAYLSTGRDGL